MARQTLPKLSHFKARGLAVVRLSGKDYYCGKWGSPEAEAKYHRVISEWLADGKEHANRPTQTIAELIATYYKHVSKYYVKDGRKTSEVSCQRMAMRFLANIYSDLPVSEFGLRQMRTVRQALIDAGRARKSINKLMIRIRGMFAWAADEMLIDPQIALNLKVFKNLRRGQGGRETDKVRPIAWETVRKIEPYVQPVIWAMVQLQWHTGMRTGELTIIRTCDIEMGGSIWLYRPESHKTEHHDHDRVVAIGPKGQAILEPWLRTNMKEYLFSPAEAELARNAARRENRQTPQWASHDPELRRRRRGQKRRTYAETYNKDTYRRAVQRAYIEAMEAEFLENNPGEEFDAKSIKLWTPHQIRHSFGTRARKQFEPDFVRGALGHSTVNVTLDYAEQDIQKAADVAKKIG